jgi:hypothetical protein
VCQGAEQKTSRFNAFSQEYVFRLRSWHLARLPVPHWFWGPGARIPSNPILYLSGLIYSGFLVPVFCPVPSDIALYRPSRLHLVYILVAEWYWPEDSLSRPYPLLRCWLMRRGTNAFPLMYIWFQTTMEKRKMKSNSFILQLQTVAVNRNPHRTAENEIVNPVFCYVEVDRVCS